MALREVGSSAFSPSSATRIVSAALANVDPRPLATPTDSPSAKSALLYRKEINGFHIVLHLNSSVSFPETQWQLIISYTPRNIKIYQ